MSVCEDILETIKESRIHSSYMYAKLSVCSIL